MRWSFRFPCLLAAAVLGASLAACGGTSNVTIGPAPEAVTSEQSGDNGSTTTPPRAVTEAGADTGSVDAGISPGADAEAEDDSSPPVSPPVVVVVPDAAPPALDATTGSDATTDAPAPGDATTGQPDVAAPAADSGAPAVDSAAADVGTTSPPPGPIATCSGECVSATDCCQLPAGLMLQNGAGAAVAVDQCSDIVTKIFAGDAMACAGSPGPSSAVGVGCFYYQTYCAAGGCGASTWSCDSNQCAYAATCSTNTADETSGCPSEAWTGRGLVATCDTKAGACVPLTTNCTSDSQCGSGVAVSDVPGAKCEGMDCTCYAGGCYLTCATNLDCQAGYACDGKTQLCVAAAACTSDAECVASLGNVIAACVSGSCGIPCTSVGSACSPPGSQVDLFCVPPPPSPAGDVHSALTN